MNTEYYLGLDMGTGSVGWAVTDPEYHLLRRKGKDLWGVRLFKTAETSAPRRQSRVSRRRLQREKARIGYLQEIFADEIEKVDPGFYQRLEDSKYFPEDKTEQQPFALFAGKDYNDKDYYQKYPTIFHLRKELLDSTEPHDVRLVYLALLNLYKHRGHFLNNTMQGDGIEEMCSLYERFRISARDVLNVEFPAMEDTGAFEEILASRDYTNTEKKERLLDLFGWKKTDKQQAEILALLCGLKGTLSKIYVDKIFDEEAKKIAVSFREGDFDEISATVESLLDEEEYELFLCMKQVHDAGLLANIMKGKNGTCKYLSYARVELYEKHHEDLVRLKQLVKSYSMEEYTKLFRIMEDNNYSAYVGSVNSKKAQVRRNAKCKEEDFWKNLRKIVEKTQDCEDKTYILQELDKGTFLPKQLTASNGVIPNQVHAAEMKQILQNAEQYLPFLKEKDESGLTASERVLKMFSFQIPYYVGSLYGGMGSNPYSKNSWSIRKESGKIYPWNFEQKINVEESAEEFIKRMVKHCTYLSGEQVLPKNSLLYERYMVLNELNNLRINGERISVELKQELYENLFRTGKKVTATKIEKFLKNNGYVEKSAEVELSGIDGDFTNRLSNYAKFCEIFGVEHLTYEQEQMAEQIIQWETVYGDSKKFLRKKIRDIYGEQLTAEQLKRIEGLKLSDWGRLSRELLETEGADRATGEILTVIQRMWKENKNLMELIASNQQYTYKEAIEEKQQKVRESLQEIEYEDLDGLYLSAPVKRMTWQTILILKELVKVMGCEPKKIFVEMARDADAEKKRTVSRKKKLLEKYKYCKKEEAELFEHLNEESDASLRRKKLYLYYMQKGRCMYTGERIELADLGNDNLYDIDHIYPRHFVKDDSLENNLVLVKKEKNAHKSDSYPLEKEIRNSRAGFWKSLEHGGFISAEKLRRLMRTEEFRDEERAGFISRQLVETRQGTKVIADLFGRGFENTQIVYVKAGNVSDFRHKFDLLKCRSVNDFHHAQDAYLNVVVGNVYDTKFTRNPYNFIQEYKKDPKKYAYNMDKMFEKSVVRNGVVAWDVEKDKSIGNVKAMMRKNTPLVTFMNYEEHGAISDLNPISAKKVASANGVGYMPMKATEARLKQTERYGGYGSIKGAYFILVEHEKGKKKVRTIEQIPIYLTNMLKTKEDLKRYCAEKLGYKNPSVRMEKIKIYSLIQVDGFQLYLTGRSKDDLRVCSATQMILDKESNDYIRNLEKVSKDKDALIENQIVTRDKNIRLYRILKEKHLNGIFAKRPVSMGERLEKGEGIFETIDVEKQVEVLLQILKLSSRENTGINLSQIKDKTQVGKSSISKKITLRNQVILINQSVTGLYKSKIDLLTV